MSIQEQLIEVIWKIPEVSLKNYVTPIVKLYLEDEVPDDSMLEPDDRYKNRLALIGCFEGQIRVFDDFNDPIDDFEEYM